MWISASYAKNLCSISLGASRAKYSSAADFANDLVYKRPDLDMSGARLIHLQEHSDQASIIKLIVYADKIAREIIAETDPELAIHEEKQIQPLLDKYENTIKKMDTLYDNAPKIEIETRDDDYTYVIAGLESDIQSALFANAPNRYKSLEPIPKKTPITDPNAALPPHQNSVLKHWGKGQVIQWVSKSGTPYKGLFNGFTADGSLDVEIPGYKPGTYDVDRIDIAATVAIQKPREEVSIEAPKPKPRLTPSGTGIIPELAHISVGDHFILHTLNDNVHSGNFLGYDKSGNLSIEVDGVKRTYLRNRIDLELTAEANSKIPAP